MGLHRAPRMREDYELRCPRDGTQLTKLKVAEVTVDRCMQCNGTWFDAAELRRVAGEDDVEAEAAHTPRDAGESAFGCPRCWGDCYETRVGDVRTDTCTSCHGVWLDAGELEAAREHVVRVRVQGPPPSRLHRVLQLLR